MKEVHGKPRLHVSVNLLFGVWNLGISAAVFVDVVVVRSRPEIPLAMITIRKSWIIEETGLETVRCIEHSNWLRVYLKMSEPCGNF